MSNWLARNAKFVSSATLPGRLFDVGTYPALSLTAERGDTVTGDLYLLPRPFPILRKLDRYEGIGPGLRKPYEYRRECVDVNLPDGTQQKAWVYVYARSIRGLRRIPGGDYPWWCRRKQGYCNSRV